MLVLNNFHKYEVAAIANLCPENSEEAKALIPRLISIKLLNFVLNNN